MQLSRTMIMMFARKLEFRVQGHGQLGSHKRASAP